PDARALHRARLASSDGPGPLRADRRADPEAERHLSPAVSDAAEGPVAPARPGATTPARAAAGPDLAVRDGPPVLAQLLHAEPPRRPARHRRSGNAAPVGLPGGGPRPAAAHAGAGRLRRPHAHRGAPGRRAGDELLPRERAAPGDRRSRSLP